MGRAVDSDAFFLHDFQQGGVCFGWRAIDFVGQQKLRKHRARAEFELLGFHVEDRGAGDIRRH